MDTNQLLIFALILVVVVVVVVLVMKKSKPKMMRHQRPPLMLGRGNGRVVAPHKESFVDQYTMDVPVSVENPLWMNSIPDSQKNPWIANIPGNY